MVDFKFNIFGTFIGFNRTPPGWQAFYLGNEGKGRPADFVVPDNIAEEDICEYLADLLHEHATPRNNEASRLT